MNRLMRGILTAFVLAFLLAPAAAEAQSAWGVSGGLVSSTFTGDDVDDDGIDRKMGFNVGAFVAFPLGDIVSFTAAGHYVQKGVEDNSDEGDASIDLAYIEVPLLLQVGLTGADRPVGIGVFAGPSIAFNISCDASVSGGGVSISGDCSDDVKSLDLGAMFGASVRFGGSDDMYFFANGGMDLGLTSIVDTDEGDEDVDWKNSAFFLNLGIGWVLGN